MRKKESIKKHLIKPDRKFSSVFVSKMINKVMRNGEKAKASNIVYEAAKIVENSLNVSFDKAIEKSIENVAPSIETITSRAGANKHRVATKVREQRKISLAFSWIVNSAKMEKNNKTMVENLAREIIDAFKETGKAFKKKTDVHKEAMSNMAFANLNK